MFLCWLVARFAALSRGTRGIVQQPDFEGLLDELFTTWPLDAEETGEVRRIAA